VLVTGLVILQDLVMPVENATRGNYDQHSFWAYPWGESVSHRSIIGTVGSPQGWKKAYYLNPIPYLNNSFQVV
jgi:hypothetical protein